MCACPNVAFLLGAENLNLLQSKRNKPNIQYFNVVYHKGKIIESQHSKIENSFYDLQFN